MGVSAAGGSGRYDQPWLVGGGFLLLIAADGFSIPFLPILADHLHESGGFLPHDVAVGLPVSVFWLAVAATQLTTGLWERGRDRRLLLAAACLLVGAGLAACAVAGTVSSLVLGRALGGLGFGAVMILVQDYFLRALGPARRTFASGLYLGLFFAGSLAGTLAGSQSASRLGYPATLALAAGLAVVVGAGALLLASQREAAPPQRLRPLDVMRNRAMLGLVLFAALPARLVNGGFVFFFVPLYLHQRGIPQDLIGWVVMIYPLVMATTAVPWSRLIDRTGRPMAFTLAGLLLSGIAMLAIPLAGGGLWPTVAAMALLGTAQAIGMSPQITVLFRVAGEEVARYGQTSVIGLYRVCERAGLMAGPVLVGALLGHLGSDGALLVLAGMMAACTAALAIVSHTSGERQYKGKIQ